MRFSLEYEAMRAVRNESRSNVTMRGLKISGHSVSRAESESMVMYHCRIRDEEIRQEAEQIAEARRQSIEDEVIRRRRDEEICHVVERRAEETR